MKSSSQLSKTRQPPLSKTSFTWRTARPQRGVKGTGGGGGASLCDEAVCPMGASALFGGRGCGAFVRWIAGGAVAASGWRCVGFAPRARRFWAGRARRPLQPARTIARRRGAFVAPRSHLFTVAYRARRPGRLVCQFRARLLIFFAKRWAFGFLRTADGCGRRPWHRRRRKRRLDLDGLFCSLAKRRQKRRAKRRR